MVSVFPRLLAVHTSRQPPPGFRRRGVCVVRAGTGSPGLPSVESTGLRTAFTDDPLARFRLASSRGDAPAALPWRGQLPHPLAGRVRACGRLVLGGRPRGGQLGCSTQTERVRRVSHRHGRDLLRSQPRARRKSFALSAGPKVLSHRIPSKARWPSRVGGPGTRLPRRPAQALRVERGGGMGDQAAATVDAQAEALGYGARDFRKGVCPRSTWNPKGLVGGRHQVGVGGETTHDAHRGGRRCIQRAALEFPPGLARVCWDHGSGKTSPLRTIFLLGLDRSFRIGNSEWSYGVDRATWESLRAVVPSGHPGPWLRGQGDGACARIPAQRQPRPAGQGRRDEDP